MVAYEPKNINYIEFDISYNGSKMINYSSDIVLNEILDIPLQ